MLVYHSDMTRSYAKVRFNAIGVFIILVTAAILLKPGEMSAQSSATLSGFITDRQSGQVLPGASVQLKGTNKGAASDSSGYFQIKNITPGSYTLTISYIGYQSVTKYNVIISSGNNPDMNIGLQPSVSQLGAISVAPDPYEQPPETPLSRQKLSRVQIASYPGGNNDIAKVVQSLPGVSGSVGGFRNDVIIRGGGPSENVYYLDGIEIPVINHFATQGSAGGPVGLLNVSFFEGVSLSTSSFPARYDNVLSGVLQFDQRNGNARGLGANVRVGASEAALTLEGPLFKSDEKEYSNTTFIASVRRSYLQLLFKLIDLPFLPDYWDYQYKVNHKIDDYNSIYITGVGSMDDFRINKPDDITAEQRATLDQIPVIKQWSSTGGISWRHRFKNSDGYLRTSLSTSIFDNDFSRYRDNENKEGLLQRTESRNWRTAIRSQYKQFLGDWTLSAGVLAEQNSYSAQSFRVADEVQFETDLNFLRYGLSGQLSREWRGGRLSASLGMRADGNTFTSEGNKIWKTFSPRAAISYALDASRQWEVSGSIGRYYKIPPSTILGFKDGGGNLVNQKAQYIHSNHLVAGITYSPRTSTQFAVEGFWKGYSNYPVSVTDSVSLANLGANFDIFGNEAIKRVGEGRAYGVEFTYQQKLRDRFYGLLAYTLYWSEFTGFDTDRYLPSRWDNRHLLTFTGGYKLPKNWEVGTRIRILGGSPYPSLNREASEKTYPTLNFDYSTLGENRLDMFNAVDIRVDKKWNFEEWSLNVYLEVTNVLGSNIPNPPEFGLQRDDTGKPVTPRKVIEIKDLDNSSTLPTVGIVVDI